MDTKQKDRLAINGGPMAVRPNETDSKLFHWPIVTQEDEEAVIDVLRQGTMSQIAITEQFEKEFADYLGVKYALGHANGTMALQVAMYAAGLRRGDELICPSITYWASALQAFSLGATVLFADIDPETLCINPNDIERLIGPRTKAIMAVHYCGHPADMDPILEIAEKHGLKVIEDVSHAHGSLYKGRMTGTIGDVAGMSMMAGKSFATGEAGMLVTNDTGIFEQAIAFAHYMRHEEGYLSSPELKRVGGLPFGGIKGRMNQTCSAMGRVQLKAYPQRIEEIQKAMNYFWDCLDDLPGISAHRPPKDSGSTMGGWYNPLGLYNPDEMNGLPVSEFKKAVKAEGAKLGRGVNPPLHLHPVFNEVDVYGDGKPTRIAFSERDARKVTGELKVSESLGKRAFGVPYFKHYWPQRIEEYANALRKVVYAADTLV